MAREPWLQRGMAAIVTGASSGIGLGIARALAGEGVTVAGLSRSPLPANALGAGNIWHIPCDVRSEEEVSRAVGAACERAGRLDVLVNAAGVSMPANMELEAVDFPLWKRIIDTNLTGLFLVTKAALPHLKRGGGYVINILSTAAFRTTMGNSPYSASKQGARAVGEAAAAEGKEAGVRVASISPGPVNTNIWNHKSAPPSAQTRERMLSSEDIADIALFLLKAPAYLSIENITVTPFRY